MRRLLGISGLGLIVLFAALVVAATIPSAPPDTTIDLGFSVFLFAGLGLYWGLGALVVLRADGHRVGWLFAIAASMLATVFGCWSLAPVVAASQPSNPVAGWAMLLGIVLFTPAIILTLPAVAIAFPTGTLPGRGWRWPVRLLAALVVLQTFAFVFRPGVMESGIDNPLTPWLPAMSLGEIEILHGLAAIGSLSILFAAGLGLAAVIVRFRRAEGDQRLQLKWFMAAMTPAVVVLLLSDSEVFADSPYIDTIGAATFSIVALSIAVAILRYRLYDIDRIISRTIAYGVITVVLAATYATAIVVFQGPLATVLGGDTISVALSTLIVAALFQPVRRRTQTIVDRRFDRARIDAERTTAAFSERLRDEVDIETLTTDLRDTVRASVRPDRLGIWLREIVR